MRRGDCSRVSPRLQACGRLQSFRVITRIRYHRLPHWEHDGSTYFITWRLERTQQALSQNERTIVMSVLLIYADIVKPIRLGG